MEKLKKTVLITGASGFIGLHIVKIFSKHNWQIFAVVNSNTPQELYQINNVKIIRADITKKELVKSLPKADIVIHAAARASDIGNDKIFKKLNFEPVKIISQLAIKKFIYISSTDVYGLKDFYFADESSILPERKIINPYQKYKIKSEKWIKENLDKNKYIIIRPAAVWGEGDKTLEKRFVDFLKYSPFIVYFGKWKGNNRWPLANVETLAKTIHILSNTDEFNGEAINIIDKKHTTLCEFYKKMTQKHFPNKKFHNIYLPLWLGISIGGISTFVSNMLRLKSPIFDPSLYAVLSVSHNLDFSCEKLEKILNCNICEN